MKINIPCANWCFSGTLTSISQILVWWNSPEIPMNALGAVPVPWQQLNWWRLMWRLKVAQMQSVSRQHGHKLTATTAPYQRCKSISSQQHVQDYIICFQQALQAFVLHLCWSVWSLLSARSVKNLCGEVLKWGTCLGEKKKQPTILYFCFLLSFHKWKLVHFTSYRSHTPYWGEKYTSFFMISSSSFLFKYSLTFPLKLIWKTVIVVFLIVNILVGGCWWLSCQAGEKEEDQ